MSLQRRISIAAGNAQENSKSSLSNSKSFVFKRGSAQPDQQRIKELFDQLVDASDLLPRLRSPSVALLNASATLGFKKSSKLNATPKSEYSLEEVFVRHYFQLFAITNRYSAARECAALAVEMLARFTIILDVLSAPKHFC